MTLFIALAIVAALLAAGLVVLPLLRNREQPAPIAATLTALVIPAAAVLLYLTGSNYGWRSTSEPPQAATTSPSRTAPAISRRFMSDIMLQCRRRRREFTVGRGVSRRSSPCDTAERRGVR